MTESRLTRRRFVKAGTAAALGATLGKSTLSKGRYPKPALLGGQPIRSSEFPIWPDFETSDEQALIDALAKRDWCRLSGDISTRFEHRWAELLGVRHCTAVANGTGALYAALNALDVGPGDEVIVPPYTFVATINAVIQQFALPVFVDTDPNTFQMDCGQLEERINERTRCVMPVHLGGSVADMDRVGSVARRHGLGVIEDACQAHFAEWRGRRVGGIGDIGCFSFQASKILPCGEGGALTTDSEQLLDRFHAFQNNGRDRLTGTRSGYQYQGSNLRITEFQSSLLLAQLTRFEAICAHREANAVRLQRLLDEIPGITPASMHEGCTRNTYYLLMFRYDERHFSGLSRAGFLRAMRAEGIPVSGGYKPLNREPFLKKTLDSTHYKRLFSTNRLKRYWNEQEFPKNERLCREGVFLGQRSLLGSPTDADQVADAVLKIQQHSADLAKS